ncbi:MAG: hypothetical protein JW943_14610 [Deltaproteobacteria bacterium]|nr:hypothetical protein [Deltaproteobacteria bacterium]
MAIEEQIEKGEPIETGIFIKTMTDRGISRHDAVHGATKILLKMAYDAVHKLDYFDINKYQELLDKLRFFEPDEIEIELERELNQYPLQ